MENRVYEFNVGITASAQPNAGTPTLSNDLVTKGYADLTYGGGGGGISTVSTKTTNYTILSSDQVILSNATSTLTLTLPAASTVADFYIVNISATGVCVIDGNGTDTINGSLTITMTAQYQSVHLVSDGGTSWYIL